MPSDCEKGTSACCSFGGWAVSTGRPLALRVRLATRVPLSGLRSCLRSLWRALSRPRGFARDLSEKVPPAVSALSHTGRMSSAIRFKCVPRKDDDDSVSPAAAILSLEMTSSDPSKESHEHA